MYAMPQVTFDPSSGRYVSTQLVTSVPFPVGYAPPPVYEQQAPVYVQQAPVYVQPAPVYVQPAPVYVQPEVLPYNLYGADALFNAGYNAGFSARQGSTVTEEVQPVGRMRAHDYFKNINNNIKSPNARRVEELAKKAQKLKVEKIVEKRVEIPVEKSPQKDSVEKSINFASNLSVAVQKCVDAGGCTKAPSDSSDQGFFEECFTKCLTQHFEPVTTSE